MISPAISPKNGTLTFCCIWLLVSRYIPPLNLPITGLCFNTILIIYPPFFSPTIVASINGLEDVIFFILKSGSVCDLIDIVLLDFSPTETEPKSMCSGLIIRSLITSPEIVSRYFGLSGSLLATVILFLIFPLREPGENVALISPVSPGGIVLLVSITGSTSARGLHLFYFKCIFSPVFKCINMLNLLTFIDLAEIEVRGF